MEAAYFLTHSVVQRLSLTVSPYPCWFWTYKKGTFVCWQGTNIVI